MKDTQLIDLFQRARNRGDIAVIEGIQAVKHAIRFGAELKEVITCDIAMTQTLTKELAPDISQMILERVRAVDPTVFNKLSPQPPRTKVIALAQRRDWKHSDISPEKPIVFLEDPRDLENIGAVIRVSAAADAAAVAISGPVDIWHPAVVRGAAGLHWALPVLDNTVIDELKGERSLISLHPVGESITSTPLPSNTILIFGTERYGISESLLKKSDKIISLPMKQGVSSLNLATSVAATLYQT